MRAWLWAPRRRRRARGSNFWPRRRELIHSLAPGRSFIDVGGMWGIHGDAAFAAEEAGATEVVLFDAMDPVPEFQRKHAERSSRVRYVQGDLHDREGVEELGTFDVAWCAGLLYHSPNPCHLLEHLRMVTRERLMLGTQVIPEVPGLDQACLFYPGAPEGARRAFAWVHGPVAPEMPGVAAPFDPAPMMGYTNYWWGITPSALRSMLGIARFEVLEEHFFHDFAVDLLARPREGDSSIPPPSFCRERDAERRAAFTPGAAPPWA